MKGYAAIALGMMTITSAGLPMCASEPWPTETVIPGECADRVPEDVLADRLQACESELRVASCDPDDPLAAFPVQANDKVADFLSDRCDEVARSEALPHVEMRVFVDPGEPLAHLAAVPVAKTDYARNCVGPLTPVSTVANGQWTVLRKEEGADPSAQRLRRLERALAGWDHTTWPSHHRSCDAPPMTTADLTCDALAELLGCD